MASSTECYVLELREIDFWTFLVDGSIMIEMKLIIGAIDEFMDGDLSMELLI